MSDTNQESIDREQMLAGLGLGKAMLDLASLNPQKIDKDQMMESLASLACPQRFKDLSCAEVRVMVMQKYIEKASMVILASYMAGVIEVNIPPRHASYINDLCEHWKTKGYTVEVQKNDQADSVITITW